MLSQKEKNIKIGRIERRLEKLEQMMLDIGNYTPYRLKKSERLLAEYQELEKRISFIQFHM